MESEMKKIFGLMILSVLLFSSCASLPEKDAADDAMLMIPIVLDKSNPGTIFGDIKITIEDENGAKVDSLLLTTSSSYKYALLKPGKYRIRDLRFIYHSNKQASLDPVDISFELYPGTITVLDQYMLYDFYRIPQQPNYLYMRGQFQDMNPDVKAMMDGKLANENAMASWDIIYPEM